MKAPKFSEMASSSAGTAKALNWRRAKSSFSKGWSNFAESSPDQQGWIITVRSQSEFGNGFQGKNESDRKVFAQAPIIPQTQGQAGRPTAKIPVNGVELLFQCPIARFKMMTHARAPVFVESIIHAGEDQII